MDRFFPACDGEDALLARWVPGKMKRYLYDGNKDNAERLLPDRYEFLLYQQLRQGLEAGDIFCSDSVRFRSIKDDLLDDEQWRNKDKLIVEAGLDILQQPIEKHLEDLKEQLETRIAEVNRRIATGENEHFKITANGRHARWTLVYPANGEAANHPFFDQMPQTDINSVLHFANRQCRFMDAFTHFLGMKQSPQVPAFIACLVAWGTNMGIGRMAQRSDVDYQTLASVSDNFLRPETLREANDRVSNATAKLPIFRHYDIGDVVHSSSDGQKFETSVRTFRAAIRPSITG